MPTSEREQLQAWSRDIVAIFQLEDLVSMFVGAEREGLVTEDAIVANSVLLLEHPDEPARLQADPDLTPSPSPSQSQSQSQSQSRRCCAATDRRP